MTNNELTGGCPACAVLVAREISVLFPEQLNTLPRPLIPLKKHPSITPGAWVPGIYNRTVVFCSECGTIWIIRDPEARIGRDQAHKTSLSLEEATILDCELSIPAIIDYLQARKMGTTCQNKDIIGDFFREGKYDFSEGFSAILTLLHSNTLTASEGKLLLSFLNILLYRFRNYVAGEKRKNYRGNKHASLLPHDKLDVLGKMLKNSRMKSCVGDIRRILTELFSPTYTLVKVSEQLKNELFGLAHLEFSEESTKQKKQSYTRAKVIFDPIQSGDLLRMLLLLPYILVVAWVSGPVLCDGIIFDGGSAGFNALLIAIPLWAVWTLGFRLCRFYHFPMAFIVALFAALLTIGNGYYYTYLDAERWCRPNYEALLKEKDKNIPECLGTKDMITLVVRDILKDQDAGNGFWDILRAHAAEGAYVSERSNKIYYTFWRKGYWMWQAWLVQIGIIVIAAMLSVPFDKMVKTKKVTLA